MQIHTVYQVDFTDGDRYCRFGFYLSDKQEADTYKKSNIYSYVTEEEIIIFDTVDEYTQHKSEETKARALMKLTAEERVALGFPAQI